MGIDYRAVFALGKEFEDQEEAVEYIENKYPALLEGLDLEDGLEEALYSNESNLTCIGLDAYSGVGYIFGYEISPFPLETFCARVKEAQEKYKDLFQENPEIFNSVQIF